MGNCLFPYKENTIQTYNIRTDVVENGIYVFTIRTTNHSGKGWHSCSSYSNVRHNNTISDGTTIDTSSTANIECYIAYLNALPDDSVGKKEALDLFNERLRIADQNKPTHYADIPGGI